MARHPSCLSSGFYSVGVTRKTAMDAAASNRKPSPSLQYLEHLSMEIAVASTGRSYTMTVHHNQTKASWRHAHAFDDYRHFQARLLEIMEQGHFCQAECPWLYSFVQHSFPKPLKFGFCTPRAMEARRFALARTLSTLQVVLLNPVNRSCAILTDAVATAFVAFLYGDESKIPASGGQSHPWETLSPVGTTTRSLSASFCDDELACNQAKEDNDMAEPALTVIPEDATSKSDTHDAHRHRSDRGTVCCVLCALHACHPQHEAMATWHQSKPRSSSVDTSLTDPTPRASFPITPRTPTEAYPMSPRHSLFPENAVLSPARLYRSQDADKRGSKRFTFSVTPGNVLHSLRMRAKSPALGPFAA